jgi:hypothetical protein
MATGFLGYLNSPKWFNIITFDLFLLFIVINIFFTTDQTNYKYNNIYLNNKSATQIYRPTGSKSKGDYYLLYKGISKINYSTNSNKSDRLPFGDQSLSSRLKEIINELNLDPVYAFENLNTEDVKKQIAKMTKGLSGIYIIINKITKDYYIGSASTDRFYKRFSSHFIYFKGSKIVKLAVKKYNLENFAFLVLELFPEIVNKENNKELMKLEDNYLKLLLPNYNILTEAGSSFGYKHTEVDRQKMKDNYSNERRK